MQIIAEENKYCESLTEYIRFKTREVNIGGIPTGGNNPIRIQSMTTADTMDTKATVEETIRLVESGCEYVRITAPSIKEAENLANIKKELRLRGYDVPLIADIHYTPNAAEAAARIVEKVRVNPGNYADKKKFAKIEFTDAEYNAEIERIAERFTPLVKICKEYGTAMRIGTNHGSLSDRIMSRYGDTPLGMVESALEFVRICESLGYYDIVLSMKASNPKVMIQAYRLLVNHMIREGMNYPLHIGVTEAGDGEEGRIKSAMGIGALLEDGLGDTIRVSLTEPPENEAPVAIKLAGRYENRQSENNIPEIKDYPVNPFDYEKRETKEVAGIGGNSQAKVVADLSQSKIEGPEILTGAGYIYEPVTDKWKYGEEAADILYLGNNSLPFEPPVNVKVVYDYKKWLSLGKKPGGFPLYTLPEYLKAEKVSHFLNFVEINLQDLNYLKGVDVSNLDNVVFILSSGKEYALAEFRKVLTELMLKDIKNPVILKRSYNGKKEEEMMLYSSSDIGGILTDGAGDGVWIDFKPEALPIVNRTLFNILQAARVRISKTEYIACPSCGRTLFDLVEVTNKIRGRTGHLKGVKIGIMGCIVNGPGEMADADYGYVGSGPGKITLYRGKEVVKKSVAFEYAVDELIGLIKEDDKWTEPE